MRMMMISSLLVSRNRIYNTKEKKLSSRHRSRSQKTGNESDEKHGDLYSPVSCVKRRKTERIDKEEPLIVLSEDEDDRIQTGDKLKSVTERDHAHVEHRKSIANINVETAQPLEQSALQNTLTKEFIIPEVPSKCSLNAIKKLDRKIKSDSTVTYLSKNFSENSDTLLKEEIKSNYSCEPLQISSSFSQCNSLEDKLTSEKFLSSSDKVLQECAGISSEVSSSTNCSSLSSRLRGGKCVFSDPSDDASKSKEKQLRNKSKDYGNSASSNHLIFYNSTEEISAGSFVTNNIENDKTVKSKYFIEDEDEKEAKSSSFCVETKIKSASLEHLNDSRSNDSFNISEEKCTSNQATISYGIVSEKNNDQIPTSDDNSDKVLPCPLCWKPFENKQSQMIHMKGCAVRHNLTTRQLIDAVELQEKQVAERHALGLPNVPSVNAVKKPTARKNAGGGADGNLHLALALSASMQEAEEREQLEEDQNLIEAGLGHEVVERQKSILERYGFTSSRPVPSSSSIKIKHGYKSKNINKATVLTKRTKEDRERIITEKVAIILIGDESKTAINSISSNNIVGLDLGSIGTSRNIQKYDKMSFSLWNASSYKEELQCHYVEALSNVITPCKIKAGDKIKHLSQLPGRNATPLKAAIVTSDSHPSISSTDTVNQIKDSDSSRKESKTRRSLVSSSVDKKIINNYNNNNNNALSLISDWRSMLNKKALSDVTVIVEKDQEIPAHKVVFYARCRCIMQDIIVEKDSYSSDCLLIWMEISYRAALAFLQFIYCGITSKLLRLEEKDMSNVRQLAKRYRVAELLEHLNVMSKVRTKVIKHSDSDLSQCHEEAGTTLSPKNVDNNLKDIEKAPSKGITFTSPKHILTGSKNVDTFRTDYLPTNLNVNEEQNQKDISNVIPGVHRLLKYDESKINITAETENEGIVNYSASSTRAESPDLFMEECSENTSQTTQNSRHNIHYLLKMIDVCFTPKNEVGSYQKVSPVKSVCESPSTSLQKSPQTMSPIKSVSGSPILLKTTPQKTSSEKPIPYSPLQSLTGDESPSYRQGKSSSTYIDNNNTNNDGSFTEKLSPQFSINGCEEYMSMSPFTSPENCVNLHNSAKEALEKTCPNKNNSQTGSNYNDSQLDYNVETDFNCVTFLDNLLSDSPSIGNNKDVQDEIINTSVESKRKYSERDSSSERNRFTAKKIHRDDLENVVLTESGDKVKINESKESKPTTCDYVIDTVDLTQNSKESDIEPCTSTFNHDTKDSPIKYEGEENVRKNNMDESKEARKTIDLEEPRDSPSKFLSKGIEEVTTVKEKSSEADLNQFQDEWDSFDEMCNAPEPEIFSQCLSKLVSSCAQAVLKESLPSSLSPHKAYSQRQVFSPNTKYGECNANATQKQSNDKGPMEVSLLAQLNESILWRDENAPIMKTSSKDRKSVIQQEHNKFRTPIQKQNNFKTDVTPPVNYSAMKTPDLKKELKRYGLKPSLTKKQAKIMLRYIYDQLHPYITVSDSEDSADDAENNLPSPFKVPGANTRAPKSPIKRAKAKQRIENILEKNTSSEKNKRPPVSVRRNLASQIDAGSDGDELSQSQESFSSSSSTCDMAEEMLFDDLEAENKKDMPLSQEISSLTVLPSVVRQHICENYELQQNVLQHEPIWIEAFHDDLKAKGFKFKMDQLMDYFDEQCITFRTVQGQRSRMRKKERQEARKKKNPVKKKGKKNSKSATTSGMDSPNSASN